MDFRINSLMTFATVWQTVKLNPKTSKKVCGSAAAPAQEFQRMRCFVSIVSTGRVWMGSRKLSARLRIMQ